jgi:hypothetical protein
MSWILFSVPTTKRSELDVALADDIVARQSRKLRDAPTLGGPSGELFVFIEGSPEGVRRAEELLTPVGKKLPPAEAEALERKLREEDDAASAGMGLFFTEE